ncbi:MAG: hypothetical protein HRT71_03960 [Flavobacteriales bacterium]|nr:hypothetical protein [Flavobacteriales bacterium]
MEIARTIIKQIRYADKWALGAYGAHNYVALPETKEYRGGLRFQVSGFHHSGFVMISLNWVDTYVISFLSYEGDVVEQYEDVYCDQLVDILDYIEGKCAV